jgi:hypothetical protein
MPTILSARVEGEEAVFVVEVRVPLDDLTETVKGKRRRLGKDARVKAIRKAMKAAIK